LAEQNPDDGRLHIPLSTIQPSYRPGVPLVQAWMALVIVARDFLVIGAAVGGQPTGRRASAERLGKHKTISQMVTIIISLALGLAAREDWHCFSMDYRRFDMFFSRLAFGLMLWTVGLTLLSALSIFTRTGNASSMMRDRLVNSWRRASGLAICRWHRER